MDRLKRFFLMTLLAALVTSSAIGVIIFLFGEFDQMHRKLLFTTLAVGGFGLIGLASAQRPNNWSLWPVPGLAIVTSIAALAVLVLYIWGRMDILHFWNGTEENGSDRKLAASFVVLAISLAHMSLLAGLQPANDLVRYCRGGALLAVVAMAALLINGIVHRFDLDNQEFYYRVLGMVAVLDILGTVSLGIFSRLAIVPKAEATSGWGRSSRPRRSR